MVNAKKGYLKDKHISPSQLNVWLKSKKEYIKQYVLGEKWQGNKFTRLGTRVHEIVEKGSEDESENTIKTIVDNYVAKYARDVLSEEDFVYVEDGITYQMILDKVSYTDDFILEVKSGLETSWTQEIVDEHMQSYFYHKFYAKKLKRTPTGKLFHIVTNREGGLTGKMKAYDFVPTEKGMKLLDKNLKDFFKWCDELTEDKIKEIMNVVTEVDEEIGAVVDTIALLKAEIEEKEAMLKEARKVVESHFLENKITKYEQSGIKLYFTEKKVYDYSPEIKKAQEVVEKLKEDIDKEIDEFKKNNEPSSITKVFTVK